jgi:ABC-type glycerol-3-phosphate transport system permease component
MGFLIIFLSVIFVIGLTYCLIDYAVRKVKSQKEGTPIKDGVSKIMVFVSILLFIYALSLIMLMVWGFYTSVKDPLDYRIDMLGLPPKWKFSNYSTVVEFFYVLDKSVTPNRKVYILEMVFNSVLYALGSSLLQATVQFIMAYLASRFAFKFGKLIYLLVIIGMTIPIVGSEPSAIAIATKLNLNDSILGMWIMKSYFLGMYFLIFYETLKAFPKDYADAAYIDGASNTRVMWKIMFPLSRTTYLTIVLLLFVGFWNDYTTPMLFMPNVPTLSYGLWTFVVGSSINEIANEPMRLAACLLLLMPILILFAFMHNKLLTNVSIGGVKE